MAATCPVGFDVGRLQRKVTATYARLAREPRGDFHFHRGIEYAVERLRYERAELESLPCVTTARFAGVANPHRIAPIVPGSVVLDVGCGAGTDLLIAARRVGPFGTAIGVDVTPEMLAWTGAAARLAGLAEVVDLRTGRAEHLPAADASVDVVISNGVLNLTPDKRRAFAEIRRVLRPGGRLLLGDVLLRRELALDERRDIDLWSG